MIVGGFLHVRYFATRLGLVCELPDAAGAQRATVAIDGLPSAGELDYVLPRDINTMCAALKLAGAAFALGATAAQIDTRKNLGVEIITDSSRFRDPHEAMR